MQRQSYMMLILEYYRDQLGSFKVVHTLVFYCRFYVCCNYNLHLEITYTRLPNKINKHTGNLSMFE